MHLRTLNFVQQASGNQHVAPLTTFPMRKGWVLRVSPPQAVANRRDPYWHIMARSSELARTDTLGRIRSSIMIVDSDGGMFQVVRHLSCS